MKIPVLKPLLPTFDRIQPYIEQIDQNRYYTNYGPLTKLFEEKLANHFGVAKDTLATCANGTLALTQVLQAFDVKAGSLCVMPSWTFVATPASAVAAGLVPYFIDVDKENWIIHPDDVMSLVKQHDIGAVIPVSPFGMPLDMDAWGKFHQDTGIPVIIDAAAGFDGFSAAQRKTDITVPVMISLHATKVFGIGEGAVLLTSNVDFAKKVKMLGNFGFYDSREALLPGTNTKLNEYMSAIGLAAIDEWDKTRQNWKTLSDLFEKSVAACPGISLAPGFNQGWVSSYGNIRLDPSYKADVIRKELENVGIGTVSWWAKGCHRQAAYQNHPCADLSVTNDLAEHVFGLPFWLGLEEKDLAFVFASLHTILDKS